MILLVAVARRKKKLDPAFVVINSKNPQLSSMIPVSGLLFDLALLFGVFAINGGGMTTTITQKAAG